ncbi:peptide deformylase [bacterium (Candidatus Gribaldobacteria) CG_4_10_14_0_2_um_filter_33_15]|nr:MAG: peptide deformylase [bacterium (Candidatus Gribaldobacteria) CG_4_10_14_0_2_um_filter_33_15]
MILELKHYPDPVLKKKAKKIKEFKEEDRKLIKDMIETMYKNKGIGLAASQVGISKRIIVVDVGQGPKVFVNPEILKKQGREISEEGCLSVPGKFLKIKRYKEISVKALDENGKEFKIKADGLLSCCLQQEIDHLNGILILNRLSFWQKLKKFFKI